MKRRAVVVVVVLALAAGGWFAWRKLGAKEEDGALRVSGTIEITDAEVAFKIPGRVAERLVSEGDEVEAGQLVARLEAADLEEEAALRRAEVEAAQAALAELENGTRAEDVAAANAAADAAKAKLAELVNGSRPEEIEAARARVAAAEADETYERANLDRAAALLAKDVIPPEEHDRARRAADAAAARLAEVKAALALVLAGPRKEAIDRARADAAAAAANAARAVAGPRKETVEAARARLAQAKAALSLAETKLGYARIVSPLTGLVLTDEVEPGEYVSPGTPVVTVGDVETVWLRAFIPETELGRVKVGSRAKVTADTWPGRVYEGRVTFLSAESEFTPKSVQTPEQRVKLVYRIKITIPNPDRELKPGMPADAEILVGAGD